MQFDSLLRRGALAIAALTLATGCLQQPSHTQGPDPVSPAMETGASDTRIEFLQKAGIQKENITVVIDSVTKAGKHDTIYMFVPRQPTAAEKAKGALGISVGFRASTIDTMILKARNRGLATAAAASGKMPNGNTPPGLAKQAQTRWDVLDNLMDVKSIPDVHRIVLYIQTTGSTKVGPKWQAAIRTAISNWNAQAKGSAVSFEETMQREDATLIVRGGLIGDNWDQLSGAVLTSDPWVYADGIQLWVNVGYESTIPHNQKATSMMAIMGIALNIGMNEHIGSTWYSPDGGVGTVTHIPGTPYVDGDPFTPGSSVFTYMNSTSSTPNLTAADLKTLRMLYPTHGITSRLSSGTLQIAGAREVITVSEDVVQFQTSNDTLYFLRSDGYLFRRIGLTGASNVQIWPGSKSPSSASVGTMTEFIWKNGYLAGRTSDGKIVTRAVGGSTWNVHLHGTTHFVEPGKMRLDGTNIFWSYTTYQPVPVMRIAYKSLTSSSSTIKLLWTTGPGLTDFQVHNGTVALIQDGDMYGTVLGSGSWTLLHSAANGYATHVRLTDHLMGMYYYPNGYPWGSVAVRHINFNLYPTFPYYYHDPVTSIEDVSMCGARMAFLQQSLYLRVVDYSVGHDVHEAYFLPNYPTLSRVKLHGENCEYVTATTDYDYLVAKYGITNNTDFLGYTFSTTGLK